VALSIPETEHQNASAGRLWRAPARVNGSLSNFVHRTWPPERVSNNSRCLPPAPTGALAGAGIKISMDGRGRWMDNVFIERLWLSLKHEDIYLKGYADGRDAKAGTAHWIAFYNGPRPHRAICYRTPMAVWRERSRPRRLWT
jgi:transposase InsO family protein